MAAPNAAANGGDGAEPACAPPTPDPTLPPGHIKVLSRTVYVGGITPQITKETLRELFETVGRVDTVTINYPKFNAFVKLATRMEAERVRQTLQKMPFSGTILKLGWGCGFGPKDMFNYDRGDTVFPVTRLTDADRRHMVMSRRGGGTVEPGYVVEEPDIGFQRMDIANGLELVPMNASPGNVGGAAGVGLMPGAHLGGAGRVAPPSRYSNYNNAGGGNSSGAAPYAPYNAGGGPPSAMAGMPGGPGGFAGNQGGYGNYNQGARGGGYAGTTGHQSPHSSGPPSAGGYPPQANYNSQGSGGGNANYNSSSNSNGSGRGGSGNMGGRGGYNNNNYNGGGPGLPNSFGQDAGSGSGGGPPRGGGGPDGGRYGRGNMRDDGGYSPGGMSRKRQHESDAYDDPRRKR
ncbi:hypothetical protein CXG81DRAFT_16688 [Caulochytrium protostelioides]|nr:hypothetical protein CXG81DRAFT_16688 [Caulochytrium protostelioides]|eukprot:RKP03855.1 hypothetical protein CXG81DRAFT_16688 [Caulochytrium protostelioides]